ncbi:MAG: hypothetical protein ACQEWG_16335 [Bacteroidota bacterium]
MKLREITKFFLFAFVLLLSCKKDTKEEIQKNEVQVIQKGVINVSYETPSISVDSVKLTITYSSDLDTVNLQPIDDRFTLLYLTQKDVTLSELDQMVKDDNTARFQENEIYAFDLRGTDSISFYYNLTPNKTNQSLKIIVDDIVFLKNYNEKGETRIIHYLTHYKEEI